MFGFGSNKTIVGLDIGSNSIKAVELLRRRGEVPKAAQALGEPGELAPEARRDVPDLRVHCKALNVADGLALVDQYSLETNILWANDYPHHEGTWPHSAQAIERQMGVLGEKARANALGLNAARMFKFDVPEIFRA